MLAKEKTLADGTLQSVMSNTFDAFNRVASTTVRNDSGNNVTTSFAYDANDHRISKTTNNVTTNQIWNGDNIICDDVGGTIKTYIQGNDTEGMLTANGFYVNIYNGRGDTVESHQLGGSTIEDYQYDAFGVNKSAATYTISNPYRYSGEYADVETGLQYLRARYYDPSIGRFTQEDTYWGSDGDSFSLNLYAYCMNNPVNLNDPNGNCWGYANVPKYTYSKVWTNTRYSWRTGYFNKTYTSSSGYMNYTIHDWGWNYNWFQEIWGVSASWYCDRPNEHYAAYLSSRLPVVGTELTSTKNSKETFTGINKLTSYGTINCVWWAHVRYYETHGYKLERTGTSYLQSSFKNTGTESRKNSIAVSTQYGHYMFIEAVSGNDIYFSEANWNDNTNFKIQKMTISNFITKRKPAFYIY